MRIPGGMRTPGLATVAIAVVAVALVGVWGWQQQRARLQLETYLDNERQRAYADLVTHADAVSSLLGKGMVSTAPGQNALLFAEASRHAHLAQASFANLPLANLGLERTARFFSQTGDFAFTLARQSARGSALADGQWEQLRRLQAESADVATRLRRVQARLADGGGRWVTAALDGLAPAAVADGFEQIDSVVRDYPSLIYDGPFSSHLENVQPRGLSGTPVYPQDARHAALHFLGTPAGYDAKVLGTRDGRIPAYQVQIAPTGTPLPGPAGPRPVYRIDVSRQGGRVLLMLADYAPGAATLAVGDARRRAEQFLTARGFAHVTSTGTVIEDGTAVFNYAVVQDGVVIYPDQVKVKVALDTGLVTGFDATGYWMSHHDRRLPAPTVSADTARRRVHPRVQLTGMRLVVMPRETKEEVLAWEIHTRLDGISYLMYINAQTGQEEQVQRVIDGPGGTLVQ